MISSIHVNGFRSLQSFTLDFNPGLNVLVGPNAAGKSNIVSFFHFLKLVIDNSLSEAVARSGGAASVFTKVGGEYQRTLAARIDGRVASSERTYKYTFQIDLTPTTNQIYFSHQELIIKGAGGKKKRGDAVLRTQVTVGADEKFTVKSSVEGFPKGQFDLSDGQINQLWSGYYREDSSILNFFRMFPFLDGLFESIARDFLRVAIFNVVPSAVKAPEDTVRTPGIAPDGSGVAASLHALAIGDLFFAHITGRAARPRTNASKDAANALSRIIETVQVAVPRIQAIVVRNDPFDEKLKCNVEFSDGVGGATVSLPLAQVSDGTAKWISLITALHTSNGGISLEEPENFLHPHMQREVVRLMRDNCSSGSFVLLTTHSETVLNAVEPKEIIVVRYQEDRTVATRAKNASLIQKQIEESGFGLGFFYLADAVEV